MGGDSHLSLRRAAAKTHFQSVAHGARLLLGYEQAIAHLLHHGKRFRVIKASGYQSKALNRVRCGALGGAGFGQPFFYFSKFILYSW